MSNKRDTMIAAVGAMHDAVQRLAAARVAYLDAYQAVSRGAYVGTGHPKNLQFEIEQALGSARLDGLLVGRLRTLGIQSRAAGAVPETWVADLTATIRAVVP